MKSVTIMVCHHLRSHKDRVVEFGRIGFAGHTKYTFKPKYPEKDRLAMDNPHICDVTDKEHINKLLSITEGYQLYLGDDEAPLQTENKNEDPDKPFGNLAELDVSAMTDDDLRKFSSLIMGVSPRVKGPIIAWFAETFDDGRPPIDPASNISDMLRQCANAIVEKEILLAAAEI